MPEQLPAGGRERGRTLLRVRPYDYPIIRIDHNQFHGIAWRPVHLGREPVDLAERGRHGVMLADERGLPALVRSPRLHHAER